ncbi:hypothetical protein [Aquimarina algiphila]|uniref:hypothetical protein n=1 Tax=Aquimarina algiphila TaxID=2047982 RepID=UPI0023300F05|nr:hypothetical protein [Aquimarina algiphila]
MNFFSKLFGKKNTQEEKKIRSNRDSISTESKTITQKEEDHELYPFLSQMDYEGLIPNNFIVPFLDHYNSDEPKVVISYVTSTQDDLWMLDSNDQTEEQFRLIMDTAQINIEKLELKYATQKVFDHKVIGFQRHTFTCEKILDQNFMIHIQKELNADSILVSIPRRSKMLICDQGAEETIKSKFMNFHYATYLSDEEDIEQICEDIFVIKNGEIEGVLYMNQDHKKN